MKYSTLLLIFTFSSLLGQNFTNHARDRIIVKFKSDQSSSYSESVSKFYSGKLEKLHSTVGVSNYTAITSNKKNSPILIEFNEAHDNINEVIEKYSSTGEFEYVEPDYIGIGAGEIQTIPDDQHFGRQWGLSNDGSFTLSTSKADADIDMDLAWDIEKGDPNMIVAVLDSGLRLGHPEFAGRIWINEDETQSTTDTDGNGYIDDINGGWDFVNDDNDPTDDHGHGTNVTGIALATGNNGIGYAGVNWNSKIMTCKILNENNSGFYSDWAQGIYYAVDNGAKVINMSVGGSGASNTLKDAIDYAYNNGVIIAVSMMNFDNDVPYYPAVYANTIAVGSTDSDDTRTSPFFWSATSGSNFGNHIDVVAPGNFIYGLNHSSDTSYGSYWGGTSQAAPLVTGLASLLLAQNPDLTFEEIREIIRNTAEDQVGDEEDQIGFDQYYGYGRINAFQALQTRTLNNNTTSIPSNEIPVLYPDPVSIGNVVYIKNVKNASIYNIALFDILGKQVVAKKLQPHNSTIDLLIPAIQKGTYIIKITDGNTSEFITQKLMITN